MCFSTAPYSDDWNAAFSNVSTIAYDVGFYNQDVYVGGNNSTSVGTSLLLGTIAVGTDGLAAGTYDVTIDGYSDGISVLGLDTATESLSGSGSFTIVPEPMSLLLFLAAGLISSIRRRQIR